ncbi:hypothetical protein POM88_020026 [Heracleum sosnowskyi]|uniref:Uncharacterized protein n=1 Tax=Heracleum sosnowskyi TaxID=360622 RepID=A0AAD8MR28_9APIA|nr:hypothetical protein POM88_020026 [Heracleum sosnowskyi]
MLSQQKPGIYPLCYAEDNVAEHDELAKEWTEKVKQTLHVHDAHELVFILGYICDKCDEEGHIWAFNCEESKNVLWKTKTDNKDGVDCGASQLYDNPHTSEGLEEITSIRRLRLGGCGTSNLTKRFFQVYSEFGHGITISIYTPEIMNWRSRPQWPDWSNWITESPYWTSGSSESESTVNAHLLQNKWTRSSLLQKKWTSQQSNKESRVCKFVAAYVALQLALYCLYH